MGGKYFNIINTKDASLTYYMAVSTCNRRLVEEAVERLNSGWHEATFKVASTDVLMPWKDATLFTYDRFFR